MSDTRGDEDLSSLATFFCSMGEKIPFERSDSPNASEMKQDALVRVLESAKRRGDVVARDCDELIFGNAPIAKSAYRFARLDFYRNRYGRGGLAGQFEPLPTSLEDPEGGSERNAEAERVEIALHAFETRGNAKVNREDARSVVWAMREVQRLKESGVKGIPDGLRKRISRLRRSTGLPLNTRLL
jgi:hypothetical protein